MKKIFTLIIYLTLFNQVKGQIWNPPQGIRTISMINLQDIATASIDNFGPVIYYNPYVCQQAGQLATAFFMAHEYGHHYLGHVVNQANPFAQAWLTLNAENQADEYALRYWIGQNNKTVIQAGVNYMWAINNSGDRTHPPSRIRAQRLANLFLAITGQALFP